MVRAAGQQHSKADNLSAAANNAMKAPRAIDGATVSGRLVQKLRILHQLWAVDIVMEF
jgi:hypothetical protein